MPDNVETQNSVAESSDFIDQSVKGLKDNFKKSAETAIEMGKTVFDVKQRFKEKKSTGFADFCEQISYEKNSSTIKKLVSIGACYEVFKDNIDKLPRSWTTLYQISTLEKSVIEQAISNGAINPAMTGNDIGQLKPSKEASNEKPNGSAKEDRKDKVPNGTLSGLSFTCKIDAVDDVDVLDQLRCLINEIKDLAVDVYISPELETALSQEHVDVVA